MSLKNNTQKFIYECIDCGKQFDSSETLYLCPKCSKENNESSPPKGVLRIVYNFSEILQENFLFKDFKKDNFLKLLPIEKLESLPKLKVGNTPFYEFNELDQKKFPFQLFLKDDSQNPTFSFKDRASAIVSAYAKEKGFKTIVAASTGNAGSSLAGLCAAQGQKAVIMVPESAPMAKLTQIIMYGATIIPVRGTYDDAFELSIKATEEFGWYNRNTAFNPLTIEGKKTVSFEIFDQLNETLPDRIFVPVGDGVIISGVYKGFEDLLNLKLISKIPTIVAVQSEGSDNLVRNLNNTNFEIKPSKTIADSISVDIPRNFNLAKQNIQKYHGEYLTVSDDAIMKASILLSRNTGIFAEPAATTAFAGLLSYYHQNKLDKDSKNVVLLTGSGLKDLNAVQKLLNIPSAIEPTIDNLKKNHLMINYTLNEVKESYSGDPENTLLKHLRLDKHITSVKDGCSGQATCGACTVEIDGKAKLACVIKMKTLEGSEIFTPEGFPKYVKDTIAKAFVNKGAVQCGFCSPGFISRTKVLLQDNSNPSIEEIQKTIKPHLCRCTGYKKIEEAIVYAGEAIRENKKLEITKTSGKIGITHPKYDAYKTAIGERDFVDDMHVEGMLYAALKFSDYPKAKVLKIDSSEAKKLAGVHRIVTAKDIPGEKKVGLILQDWSVMIDEGETTHYIGDVIAGVVADSDDIAREAVKLIKVDYEVLEAVTDVYKAIDGEQVHLERPNNFDTTQFTIGDANESLKNSKYTSKGKYETQRIEHAFLEKEAAIARPDRKGGLELFSQSQGVYEDRRQVAMILGLAEEKVRVTLVPNGGGFGGKEDLSIQGHTSLFAWLLEKPIKLTLSRKESIRVHPKRHPVYMDIELGANEEGKLTALKLRAIGDTGAYASVGMKVLERVAGHASAGYFVPVIDIEAKTVYTNNIPCGAMRGFGANQVSFALESCIDELCEKAGFDRWQFRYDNALVDGLKTSTGQTVFGVGIRACLDAVKEDFNKAKYAGLACAIKNSGVGNGMIDESKVIIEIIAKNKIRLHHGWTEMGQGVHNMALQTLCEETSVSPDIIEVLVDTEAQIKTGMTTSSRATALVGLAVINAAKAFKEDLKTKSLEELTGKSYKGQYVCDWTTKPGTDVKEQITHYSYGYAAQVCILDDNGKIQKMIAAHDGGKIMNPMLFEGQVEGGVHMGLGYALTESLPMKDGYLVSDNMRDLKILRAHETPEIEVIMIEVKDPVGPYGAKGIGEIGLVPTAAAVSCAFVKFDGKKRYKLPLLRDKETS